MNEAVKVAREQTKQVQIQALKELAFEALKNPVLEIVLGYLIIETAQKIVVGEEYVPGQSSQWGWLGGVLGYLGSYQGAHMEKHYLISDKAGTVAEGGLLVAVALQQGGKDLLTSLIQAGGNTMTAGIGLAGKAIPGIAGLLK